jgi:hypothetical protein
VFGGGSLPSPNDSEEKTDNFLIYSIPIYNIRKLKNQRSITLLNEFNIKIYAKYAAFETLSSSKHGSLVNGKIMKMHYSSFFTMFALVKFVTLIFKGILLK